MAKILIIGYGDIGSTLAQNLLNDGHQVSAIKRTEQTNDTSVKIIQLDVSKAEEVEAFKFNVDQIVYILSPNGRDILGYQAVFEQGVDHVLSACKKQCPEVSITFVSSTRVYGQQQGEWLDETSPTEPTDQRGKILLAAENKFLAFNDQTSLVRFSGIYGRSNYFLNQLKAGEAIQKEPPYYTNRIHRDDCIAVLCFIINKKINGEAMVGVYLATDHEPATRWQVACYLAEIYGMDGPKPLTLDETAKANKRLQNKRLTAAGYVFKYKTYQQGYKATIDEQA